MTDILLVDDDPESLRLLSDILERQGYAVRSLRDGRMALAAVQSAPPDLILLDILMLDMDGYEVCRQLKADEQAREIPVIFLSALHEAFDKIKAFALGGVDYIAKPFQVEEVLARIRAHLALQRLQQQLQQQNSLLHEQNERFQRLSEATFEGIIIADQGGMLDVNQRLAAILGYQGPELLNTDVLTVIAPDARKLVQAYLNARHDYPYQTEGIRKDGAWVPVEIQYKTISDETSKVFKTFEVFAVIPLEDISSRNVDVRIIAATNRDLSAELRQGRMRKDFFTAFT